MSNHHAHSEASNRVILFWHKIRVCYRYANIVSHHVLGAVVKTLIVLYFLFCLSFLSLRYAVLPHIDHYKPDIERAVSHAIGQPVTIGRLDAAWDGLRPRLALQRVVIKDNFGRDALTLPKVDATVSWLSVVMGTLRLYELEIDRPDMDIRRDADGNLFVAGIPVPSTDKKDGKGGDWLLSQRAIVIRHGTVRWNDGLRVAPELQLSDVNLELRNHWQHHEFAFNAVPPARLAAPIDLRVAFDHPAFAAKIADPSVWKGELYLDLGKTDLAAWNAYVPFPNNINVQRGHGALRAWLDFNRAKVADFTADMTLADAAVRFQNLPVLELDQVSGRLSLREQIDQRGIDGTPTFGSRGHSISLTNFSFRTNDGMVLPPTTVTESFEPGVNGQGAKTKLSADVLDLQTLSVFATKLPFNAESRQMLEDFAPQGQLRNFTAQWQGSYPALTAYDVKGQFVGLSIKGQAARPARSRTAATPAQAAIPLIPGFSNLTGSVAMTEAGGNLKLASENMAVEAPGMLSEPVIPFQKLAMEADWSFEQKDSLLLKIDSMDFLQDGLAASFTGTYALPLNHANGKSPGVADFTGHIDAFEMNKVGHYLPENAEPQFRDWITNALVGGSVRDVTVRIKGDMKDFPFHTEAGEKPKGEFSVSGRIVDGVLNYDKRPNPNDARLPMWPLLEDIQGTIKFDRRSLVIVADHAKTHGAEFSDVKAVIEDVIPPKNSLEIVGNATGSLQDFLGYTVDSPVQRMIGGFTDESKGNGSARLYLKLSLPLSHLNDSKVQGKLQFMGNDIGLLAGLPPLNGTTGALEFSEKGFNLNNVHTVFLGGSAQLSGGGPNEAAVIHGDGTLTADGLRKFATDGAQRVAQRINGSTHYSVAISLKKKHADVVVESNLQGLALNLPSPLHKESAESMPAKFEMLGLPSPDNAPAREEIKVALGSAVTARYEREKAVERNAPWHVVKGGIGVFATPVPPASGVLLNVSLKSLNVDTWLDMLDSFSAPDKAHPNGSGSDAAFAEFFNPQFMQARTTEMIVFGRKLDNVDLSASLQKDVWQASLTSTQVSGDITYSATAGQGKGLVTAKLKSLVIPKAATTEVTDLLQGKTVAKDLPALDIEAADFDLFDKKFGALKLVADNVRAAGGNEWSISQLNVKNPDAELKAHGSWNTRNGQSTSTLSYTLDLINTGKTLDRLGFQNVLKDSPGSMTGDISWNGAPYSLDLPSLSGQVKLDIGKGQFLKKDPGAAKLFGVLSLQSLPRRLTLDFRDVFSAGFAFDGLTMSAAIDKGVMTTRDLKMHGVDATVLMEGSADIVNETQNLHVAIVPKLDAGAASLGYALINPAIGLGSFLAQLFLREPLSRALTDELQITGPWDDPKVTKLDHKGEKLEESAKPGATPAK